MADLKSYNQTDLFSSKNSYDHLLSDEGDPMKVFSDHISPLIKDSDFESLYKDGGRPPISPRCLALVTLLQFMERLPDRQAVRQLRYRIDWKIALDLPMDFEGFSYRTLSVFRQRLVESEDVTLVFDKVISHLKDLKLIKSKGSQRLDSTTIIGNIRHLSRVELLLKTLQLAVKELLNTNPDLIRNKAIGDILIQFSDEFKLFGLSEVMKDELISQISEAMYLLKRFVKKKRSLRELPALKTLIDVYDQHFEIKGKKNKLKEVSTGKESICTPHDPEAHYSGKNSTIGYQAQIAETANKGGDNFVTGIAVENNANHDSGKAQEMLDQLEEKDLKPSELYVDQGYTGGSNIKECEAREVDLVGKVKQAPKLKIEFDSETNIATCPAGKKSILFSKKSTGAVMVTFSEKDCSKCPLRRQCKPKNYKNGHGKVTSFAANHQYIQRRRDQQEGKDYKTKVHRRNAIEGTISALKRGYSLHRCRYKGELKCLLQTAFTVAAYNIKILSIVRAKSTKAPSDFLHSAKSSLKNIESIFNIFYVNPIFE